MTAFRLDGFVNVLPATKQPLQNENRRSPKGIG